MFDYEKIKRTSAKNVNKTLSEPIMLFDFLEIKEGLIGMACFLWFGIIETQLMMLFLSIGFLFLVWPQIRERLPRGYFVHKINKYTPIKIPGSLGLKNITKFNL